MSFERSPYHEMKRNVRLALPFATVLPTLAMSQSKNDLVGTWKLVSVVSKTDKGPVEASRVLAARSASISKALTRPVSPTSSARMGSGEEPRRNHQVGPWYLVSPGKLVPTETGGDNHFGTWSHFRGTWSPPPGSKGSDLVDLVNNFSEFATGRARSDVDLPRQLDFSAHRERAGQLV